MESLEDRDRNTGDRKTVTKRQTKKTETERNRQIERDRETETERPLQKYRQRPTEGYVKTKVVKRKKYGQTKNWEDI